MDLISNFSKTYELMSDIPQFTSNDRVGAYLRAFNRALRGAKKFRGKKRLDILDAGGAEGTLAIALAELGHNVTISDISAESCRKAKATALERGLELKTAVNDLEKSPINGKFDCIFFTETIEHLRAPPVALCNLRRSLRGGAC